VNNSEPSFLVVTAAYNAERWIARCLTSLADQHVDFRCVVCDDCSEDETYRIAQATVGDDARFTLERTDQRCGMLQNIDEAIRRHVRDPNEVIVILDGDDWLKHERVFDTLEQHYRDSATWMTYGSYERWDGTWQNRLGFGIKRGHARRYPDYIADNNFYRYYTFLATHLRTFRAFLWQRLEAADLRDDAGNYFQSASDVAAMIPMLEMSGPAHAVYIREILLVYNNENPLGIRNSGRRLTQKISEMTVRSRARYWPIGRSE
jgi:glycosyltransferase involved in cell wall biosynthesis